MQNLVAAINHVVGPFDAQRVVVSDWCELEERNRLVVTQLQRLPVSTDL